MHVYIASACLGHQHQSNMARRRSCLKLKSRQGSHRRVRFEAYVPKIVVMANLDSSLWM